MLKCSIAGLIRARKNVHKITTLMHQQLNFEAMSLSTFFSGITNPPVQRVSVFPVFRTKDGVDYHFVSRHAMEEMIAEGTLAICCCHPEVLMIEIY